MTKLWRIVRGGVSVVWLVALGLIKVCVVIPVAVVVAIAFIGHFVGEPWR